MSPIVAGCLYVSLLVPVSHCLFQFQGVAACLYLSLIAAECLSLSLQSNRVATFLSLYPTIVCCLSLSLWSH